MNAMLLAAGRGERLRPLTDRTPKPLLSVGGRPLIDWHLRALARAGVERVVINVAWLADEIRGFVGDGDPWGLEVVISDERPEALETGGGIHHALPLLGDAPFWVINGDVWSDFELATLPRAPDGLAHIVLVDNPTHHFEGDFALRAGRVVEPAAGDRLTFSGIGCYSPRLFAGCRAGGAFRLAPLLRSAAREGKVTASRHRGLWCDVGTPERLAALNASISVVG